MTEERPLPDADFLRDDPFAFPEGAFVGPSVVVGVPKPQPHLGYRDVRYLTLLRHVPTRDTLAHATRGADGRTRDLLARWHAIWAGMAESWGGDVDRLCERVGLGPYADPADGLPVAGPDVDEAVGRLAGGEATAGDAHLLFLAARRLTRTGGRPRRLHVLEDAALAVALTDAGVAWGYVLSGEERSFLLVPGRPVRRRVARLPADTRVPEDVTWSPLYWRSRAFQESATRWMREADDALHAACVLLDLARQGRAKAFVKACSAKAGTWVVDLAGVVDERTALLAMVSAMGPMAWSPQGHGRGFLLVQEFRRFVAEHRFFVSGGRVVASTPSDRSMGVMDAHRGRGRLDPRVADLSRPPDEAGPYDRGVTTRHVDRAAVALMAREVRAFLRRLDGDVAGRFVMGHSFVVDVGVDDAGRPELIEVNRIRHVGLYGVDCGRLARALAAAPATEIQSLTSAFTLSFRVSPASRRRPRRGPVPASWIPVDADVVGPLR